MTTSNIFLNFFNSQFAGAKQVEFNFEWLGSFGYMSGIPGADKVSEVSCFVDPHGRRGIIFPNVTGNVGIFQCYDDDSDVLVMCFADSVDEDGFIWPESIPFRFGQGQDELICRLMDISVPATI